MNTEPSQKVSYRAFFSIGRIALCFSDNCVTAATPEAVRDLFFKTFPAKRKCNIHSGIANEDNTFTGFYSTTQFWKDVTRKTALTA